MAREMKQASVYVAVEEVDALAFLGEIVHEVEKQEIQGDLWEYIDDAAGITVGNVAVVTTDVSAAGVRILGVGRSLELVNTEGVQERGRLTEIDGA